VAPIAPLSVCGKHKRVSLPLEMLLRLRRHDRRPIEQTRVEFRPKKERPQRSRLTLRAHIAFFDFFTNLKGPRKSRKTPQHVEAAPPLPVARNCRTILAALPRRKQAIATSADARFPSTSHVGAGKEEDRK
jgi:hypothetical protein